MLFWLILTFLAQISCVYLWSECVWCSIECGSDGLLSNFLALNVVKTSLTVAVARHAVKARCKALTIELKTLRVTAIASFPLDHLGEELVGMRRYNFGLMNKFLALLLG